MEHLKQTSMYTYLDARYNIDKYTKHFIASIFIITFVYYFSNIHQVNIFTILVLMSIFLTLYLIKVEKDMNESLNKKVKLIKKRIALIKNKMKNSSDKKKILIKQV
jgi:hypothetical protein|tara:strand:+ start:211 stop:528 length:318 start_codon:yes stop_codon:yes gene_type:complete